MNNLDDLLKPVIRQVAGKEIELTTDLEKCNALYNKCVKSPEALKEFVDVVFDKLQLSNLLDDLFNIVKFESVQDDVMKDVKNQLHKSDTLSISIPNKTIRVKTNNGTNIPEDKLNHILNNYLTAYDYKWLNN
jgi:hypothetical protein